MTVISKYCCRQNTCLTKLLISHSLTWWIQGLSRTCPVFKYIQGLEFRRKKFKYFQGLSRMRGNPVYYYLILLSYTIIKCPTAILTLIHGCLSACAAVIRRAGLTVNMLFMRFFASVVTVSHSGDGYYTHRHTYAVKHHSLHAIRTIHLALSPLWNNGQQVSPAHTVGCHCLFLAPADSSCL